VQEWPAVAAASLWKRCGPFSIPPCDWWSLDCPYGCRPLDPSKYRNEERKKETESTLIDVTDSVSQQTPFSFSSAQRHAILFWSPFRIAGWLCYPCLFGTIVRTGRLGFGHGGTIHSVLLVGLGGNVAGSTIANIVSRNLQWVQSRSSDWNLFGQCLALVLSSGRRNAGVGRSVPFSTVSATSVVYEKLTTSCSSDTFQIFLLPTAGMLPT
jgi:hypothetical protein